MRMVTAYIIGLIFGVGIVISGMGNPAKVLNFFDIAGTWDPSLIFVMGGALTVTFIGYMIVFKRPKPMLAESFPDFNAQIDLRLIGGSVVFGIGWGITGFCPGGAIPVIGTGKTEVLIFAAALIAGIIATRIITNVMHSRVERRVT